MKTIQVRNVPDEVHRELRERARAAGISLSDLALGELERAVRRPAIAEVLARADARRDHGVDVADIVADIRSWRDRD